MLEITLWDDDAPRLQSTSQNLSQALRDLNLTANVTLQSEPPLLSRHNLLGRTPAVEINNHIWTYTIGKVISTENFTELFITQILKR